MSDRLSPGSTAEDYYQAGLKDVRHNYRRCMVKPGNLFEKFGQLGGDRHPATTASAPLQWPTCGINLWNNSRVLLEDLLQN